jgi:predicted Rossmann-fold nucleotide-binding protein
MIDFMRDRLLGEQTIAPADLNRIFVTDSPERAVEFITEAATQRFGLKYGPRPKRSWLLGE